MNKKYLIFAFAILVSQTNNVKASLFDFTSFLTTVSALQGSHSLKTEERACKNQKKHPSVWEQQKFLKLHALNRQQSRKKHIQ